MKFDNIAELVQTVDPLMRDYAAPWAVAGGWAIDLFLDRNTRPHDDLELALFRIDQDLMREHLQGWHFQKVVAGAKVEWLRGETLILPVHEAYATSVEIPARTIEFVMNERISEQWVFRRNFQVTRPMDRAIVRSNSGLPILAPEIVLLYKSKSRRARDEADFSAVCKALGDERRRWLHDALRMSEPDHPWLARSTVFPGITPSRRRPGKLNRSHA